MYDPEFFIQKLVGQKFFLLFLSETSICIKKKKLILLILNFKFILAVT